MENELTPEEIAERERIEQEQAERERIEQEREEMSQKYLTAFNLRNQVLATEADDNG